MRKQLHDIIAIRTMLDNDLRLYNDFQKVYGALHDDEILLKRQAISSLSQETHWCDSADDLLRNIRSHELFEDWEDNRVYVYMILWLKNNTDVNVEHANLTLKFFRSEFGHTIKE